MFKKRYLKVITLVIITPLLISYGQSKKINSNSVANEKATNSLLDNNSDTKKYTTGKTPDNSVQTPVDDNKRKLSKIHSIYKKLDVSQSQFKKGYYDYQGIINGNRAIQMSIYPLTNDIVGSYYYDDKEIEIMLEGKAGAKNIILLEYDGEGNNTGIFQGTMKTVDKIEGTWISTDCKNSYHFTLSLRDVIISAEYGKRYAVIAGNKSDKDIENFVCEIKSYIVKNNKEQVAEL
ncbi:MAG: hypothetical protein ABRQ25_09425 [Clostridiaceae bacterium]